MTIKHAGLALMVGMILAWIGGLFLPGFSIINPTDQTDFPAAVAALGDAAILAHWMNFIMLISMLLLIFGLLGFYPVASRQAGLGGKLLRFGIIASIIEWSTIIIVIGMRFFEIHLMQRSNMPHDGGELLPADFVAAALALHISLTAVLLASVMLYPLASIMVGLGIASRFASTNLYKVAGYVMAAAGLLGLVNILVAMNIPDAGIQNMFLINSIALYAAGVALFIFGFGMYRGQAELADES